MSDADLARDLHQQLLAARRDHRRAEHTLAVLLTRFADGALFVELGYATVYEYAREVLDLGARRARDLLHIGRSLPDLPVLDAAFAGGELGWTKARELLRVATPDNEAAWVETAPRVHSRTLERLVAATPVGDPPPPDDEPRAPSRTRMIFDLHTADADHIRTAVTMLRQQTPGSEDLSDGQLLALMAQRVLHDAEGSEVPTGDRYRVLLQHCPNCGHTTGVCSEADETIVNEACCDHDLVDLRPGPGEGTLTRSIRPSARSLFGVDLSGTPTPTSTPTPTPGRPRATRRGGRRHPL